MGGLEILMFMTCLRLLIQIIDSTDHLNKGQSLLEGGGRGIGDNFNWSNILFKTNSRSSATFFK